MEHKKAITVLIKLLDKHPLGAAEKQAVLTAIGVLSWATLAKNRIKSLKVKRDQRAARQLRD